jgi:hypothetical protein
MQDAVLKDSRTLFYTGSCLFSALILPTTIHPTAAAAAAVA